MARARSLVVLLCWCAALAASIAGLHALGDGPFAAPGDWASLGGWAAERDPLVATVALARLLALCASWYLAAATALATVAELVRIGALVRAADLLAVAPVRRLARAACSATLAVGAAVGPVAPALAAPALPGVEPPPVQRHAVVDAEGGASSRGPADEAADSATGEAAEEAGETAGQARQAGEGSGEAADDPPAGTDPPAETDAPLPPPVVAGDHVVAPGESFWSIASAELRRDLGREPTDTEVVPRWRAWIAANEDRLRVAGEPDLLWPGQELRVPDRPADAA